MLILSSGGPQQKEKTGETQFTTMIDGFLSFIPCWMLMYFFAGFFLISPCICPTSGLWSCVFLTFLITLMSCRHLSYGLLWTIMDYSSYGLSNKGFLHELSLNWCYYCQWTSKFGSLIDYTLVQPLHRNGKMQWWFQLPVWVRISMYQRWTMSDLKP
jgi:hypothetical protein